MRQKVNMSFNCGNIPKNSVSALTFLFSVSGDILPCGQQLVVYKNKPVLHFCCVCIYLAFGFLFYLSEASLHSACYKYKMVSQKLYILCPAVNCPAISLLSHNCFQMYICGILFFNQLRIEQNRLEMLLAIYLGPKVSCRQQHRKIRRLQL